MSKGRPDAAPKLRGIFADAVLVEQWDRAATPFRLPPGVKEPKKTRPESLRDLQMSEEAEADVNDAANDLAARGWGPLAAAWGAWPLWTENGFTKDAPAVEFDADPRRPRAARIRAVVLGVGTGEPNQSFALPCPPDRMYFSPSRRIQAMTVRRFASLPGCSRFDARTAVN